MSCQVLNCSGKIVSVCESHNPMIYFCQNHSQDHYNPDLGHLPRYLNSIESKLILRESLNSLMESCILQMSQDTESIIKALKNSCKQAIKSLKDDNKDIESISEFRPLTFHKERINFLISEASCISQDYLKSSHRKIKEMSRILYKVTDNLNETKQTLLAKSTELENSNKELSETTRKLFEAQNEIESLKWQLDKSNQIIILNQEDFENLYQQYETVINVNVKRKMSFDRSFNQLKDRKIILNDMNNLRKIMESIDEKEKRQQSQGKKNTEFNEKAVEEQILYVKSTWPFINIHLENNYKFLWSYDGKYLFRCIQHSGKFYQDCNLD